MKRKGQAGAIGVIFLLIVFIVNWLIWLAPIISDVGQDVIKNNNLTGIEAFFFANLNLVIFFALLLGVMAYLYLGGRQ